MRDLVRQLFDALALVGAFCALLLFAAAVIGFLAAVVRVGLLGRLLVLPFRGTDERRVELTGLFARRLMEIEEQWTALAREIKDLKARFESRTREPLGAHEPSDAPDEPLARGDPLSLDAIDATTESFPSAGAGPRTTGDDFLDDIALLEEAGSVANADLGVVSVAGVSFSPQSILALLRALPAVFARRVLSGSIVKLGGKSLLAVTYEERELVRRTRPVRRSVEVEGEDWLPAIENLAFQLAKGRIELLRHKHGHAGAGRRALLTTPASEMADRAVVEATSWPACEAFLNAYVSHLRHYISGSGRDRDRALRCYESAVEAQPGYARATYHRATLLYNRYLPTANQEAIAGFRESVCTDDSRVRALAYAGLAMAYCQAAQRFGENPVEVLSKAWQASEDAIQVEPDLEEAGFAQGWARQIREEWDAAVHRYDAVAERAGASAPARRIASFALNNAGWIWLEPLKAREDALRQAERRFWRAVRIYPNKIGFGNLAEVARRYERYGDARAFFGLALKLDPQYVNAWNERACLEVEIAATTTAAEAADALAAAAACHARAVELAGDEDYALRLRAAYEAALDAHSLSLKT